MDTTNDQLLPQEPETESTPSTLSPVADSAMATGTDDEPEMTIADKHAGEPAPDLDGDGVLTKSEAATLLGENEERSGETK